MSDELQSAKALASAYFRALDEAAPGGATSAVCAAHLSPKHSYRGVHPFNTIEGTDALADQVWSPLKTAMPVLQRRPDIFFAGRSHLKPDGAVWVVEMGNFLGDFTAPWLGVGPTNKTTFIPYVTWLRIEDGEIAETVEWLDILAVITQAGQNPYIGDQTAAHLMSPGPLTHDGLLHAPQAADETTKTFALTEAMLTELAQTMTSPADHMARYWRADMNWFGPTGIGACLGFAGYRRGHTGPFEAKQDFVDYHPEEAAAAEGRYAAFLWRPCLGMRNTGGYMGAPANDVVAEMRVVDLYRRDGDKLAENWIFIDMLHFLKMQGVDLLAQIGGQA